MSSHRARVALATCRQLPAGDEDERLLPPALAALGIEPRFAVWDDGHEPWEDYDLVIVRATWDYPLRRDAFLAWAGALPRVLNAPDVLRWNTDKRYLDDLAAAGLPVVPTAFVTPGGPRPPLHGEVVVKPAVSGGAMRTGRFGPARHAEAHAHLTALGDAGDVAMVQPYLEAVDERGETALVFVDGAFSHAIRKGPLLGEGEPPAGGGDPVVGLFAAEDISPREAAPAERAVASATIEYLTARFGPLLYARVDLVPGLAGDPLLLEVELTEPSLFLRHSPDAAQRLARAIATRL